MRPARNRQQIAPSAAGAPPERKILFRIFRSIGSKTIIIDTYAFGSPKKRSQHGSLFNGFQSAADQHKWVEYPPAKQDQTKRPIRFPTHERHCVGFRAVAEVSLNPL